MTIRARISSPFPTTWSPSAPAAMKRSSPSMRWICWACTWSYASTWRSEGLWQRRKNRNCWSCSSRHRRLRPGRRRRRCWRRWRSLSTAGPRNHTGAALLTPCRPFWSMFREGMMWSVTGLDHCSQSTPKHLITFRKNNIMKGLKLKKINSYRAVCLRNFII